MQSSGPIVSVKLFQVLHTNVTIPVLRRLTRHFDLQVNIQSSFAFSKVDIDTCRPVFQRHASSVIFPFHRHGSCRIVFPKFGQGEWILLAVFKMQSVAAGSVRFLVDPVAVYSFNIVDVDIGIW